MSTLTYAEDYEPGLPLDVVPGETIVFMGKNGTAQDLEKAKKSLEIDGEYRLQKISIGGFHSRVELEGVSGAFNSVHFRRK